MTAADMRDICLPAALSCVSELVESKPEGFLEGDEAIRTAALEATKYVFDLSLRCEKRARLPIMQLLQAIEPSTAPETRSQRKRKRSPPPSPQQPKTDKELWRPTPLESLHLDGMNDDQVWAQLELRATALCDTLKIAILAEDEGDEGDSEGDGVEVESNDEEVEEESDQSNDEFEVPHDSEDWNDEEDPEVEEEEDFEEEVTELRDSSDPDTEDVTDLDRPTRPRISGSGRVGGVVLGKQLGGHPILDDGFFSLADFNAETEEAEAKNASRSHLSQTREDDDDDLAEDDVDFFATIDEAGTVAFEEDDLEDAGEPYYKDFFDPPPRGSLSVGKLAPKEESYEKGGKRSKVRFDDEVRVKKIKSRGKGLSVASMQSGMLEEEDEEYYMMGELGVEVHDEDDMIAGDSDELDEEGDDTVASGSRETIERLKDDLFAEDEEALSRDLSTHEVRQAQIAAQIAELESQNVAPKEWSLMGEATSRSRPVNSLLEEDLEFERVMKVMPVVTEERVSSLEEIIKNRILDSRFDDVVRKRAVDDKPLIPSRFFELNDQKSAQSLAQIYEDEYSAAASGHSGADDRDGKLKKEHEELDRMWERICYKLDALSNTHFTPKQPKATIFTVSNLPTASLESAIPTTQSTTTMLTPEEIFATSGEIRSRNELTPTEKRAYRNKKRKVRRKASDYLAANVDKFARMHKAKVSSGDVKKDKEKALKNVVKTTKGVTVVGKKSVSLKRKKKEM